MTEELVRSLAGGVNLRGVRDHNARLILSMIQRHGALPGSDLARMAGLSAQAVSVILRGLEQEGFVRRGEPQRGRVGKPRVPVHLAADGVFSFGLKLGRRSADLVLVDLSGELRMERQLTYRWPMPGPVMEFLRHGIAEMTAALSPHERRRLAGIGIAKPFEIWDWPDAIGAPLDDLTLWRDFNFATALAEFTDLPVLVENDATAACRAELTFGRGREFGHFAYFFVGSFVGGGVAINHSVFEGPSGNAGAFGSLPVRGGQAQLIDTASLYLLEKALTDAGRPLRLPWLGEQDWSRFEPLLSEWIDSAAPQIAQAALTLAAVIDFEAVLIDGSFPVEVRLRLVDAVRRALPGLDARGVVIPRIEEGTTGARARSLGAAYGPILGQFLLDTHAGFAAG